MKRSFASLFSSSVRKGLFAVALVVASAAPALAQSGIHARRIILPKVPAKAATVTVLNITALNPQPLPPRWPNLTGVQQPGVPNMMPSGFSLPARPIPAARTILPSSLIIKPAAK